MTPSHHPGDDLLLDYAGGTADEGVALIVTTHLCFCPLCRRTVAMAESVGGVLLAELPPENLAPGALAATLTRLDEGREAPRPTPSRDNTPPPLRALLGGDLSAVRWRRMGPRLGYRNLFRRGGMRARLLRGAPGTDTGLHSHRGLEYTLVLAGGYTDESGCYGPGDFQLATPETLHNPIADPGEDCINLSVTTSSLAFRGLMQRIVAPLFGF